MLYKGTEVIYDLNCDKAVKLHSSSGVVYRDIQLDYFTWEPAEGSSCKNPGWNFLLEISITLFVQVTRDPAYRKAK